MKINPLVLPLCMLIGCASAPSPKTEAISHARPFLAALQAYRIKSGNYPPTLDDLCPRYLRANVPVYDNGDAKHLWFLFYQRIDQNHYKLFVDSAPCSQAIFENGTFVAGIGPNFP